MSGMRHVHRAIGRDAQNLAGPAGVLAFSHLVIDDGEDPGRIGGLLDSVLMAPTIMATSIPACSPFPVTSPTMMSAFLLSSGRIWKKSPPTSRAG